MASEHDEQGSEELRRQVARGADVTWGAGRDSDSEGADMRGLLMGDVGPKGAVGAAYRRSTVGRSRGEGLVPRGTSVDGTGRYILGLVLLVIGVAGALVALLWWALA